MTSISLAVVILLLVLPALSEIALAFNVIYVEPYTLFGVNVKVYS